MPFECEHLKYISPTLALLREHYPGFCPLCAMEKLYNDAQTPPELKKRLRRQIDAYTGVGVSSRKILPCSVM
jgi:hypothetical protein